MISSNTFELMFETLPLSEHLVMLSYQ